MATEREMLELTPAESEKLSEKIRAWIKRGQQRGRPSCPCGFVGGCRNIISHRKACFVWGFYCKTPSFFEETAHEDRQP